MAEDVGIARAVGGSWGCGGGSEARRETCFAMWGLDLCAEDGGGAVDFAEVREGDLWGAVSRWVVGEVGGGLVR